MINYKEIIKIIKSGPDFINTGNSIRYTGIRGSKSEILGTDIKIFQKAIDGEVDLSNYQFIGVWDRNRSLSKPIPNTANYLSIDFPEWSELVERRSGNHNGAIHDYLNNELLPTLTESFIGILVYVECEKTKLLLVTCPN